MNNFAFDRENDAYAIAAHRLSSAFEQYRGVEPKLKPSEAMLQRALDKYFHSSVFSYGKALKGSGDVPKWHLIRVGEAGEELLERIDQWTLQPSLGLCSQNVLISCLPSAESR